MLQVHTAAAGQHWCPDHPGAAEFVWVRIPAAAAGEHRHPYRLAFEFACVRVPVAAAMRHWYPCRLAAAEIIKVQAGLTALQPLNMSDCWRLQQLPDSFGVLTALQHLDLQI